MHARVTARARNRNDPSLPAHEDDEMITPIVSRAVSVWEKKVTAIYAYIRFYRGKTSVFARVSGRVSSQHKQEREIPLCCA